MKIKDLKDLIAKLPDDADVLIRSDLDGTTRLATGFPAEAACVRSINGRRENFVVVDNNTPSWLDGNASPCLVLEW